nr:MAG TPA: hypothetical protein [Caudoviricetes sp.]
MESIISYRSYRNSNNRLTYRIINIRFSFFINNKPGIILYFKKLSSNII